MAVRKLCLRLNDENPLHNEAWTKIEASGKSIQGYLLAAVMAYEHRPLKGLQEVDIDKIAERIIWRLSQTEQVIGSAVPTASSRKEPQIDQTKSETNEKRVPDNISGFLSDL